MKTLKINILAALTLTAALIAGCGQPITTLPEVTKIVAPDYLPDADQHTAGNIDESVLPPVEVKRLSFLAAGDNVIHPCIYMDAERRASAERAEGLDVRDYDFKPMYADAADFIASFDLAFINQETLMAGEEFGYSGYPTFNSPRDLAYDLIELGFDIVNIANNHMCDKGTSGLKATVDFWKGLDVTMIGGYSDAEDYDTPRIIERDGIKLALIGYTEETNGIRLGKSELIVPYTKDEDIKRQVSAAKEIADLVIVSVHWGNENQNTPTKEQKRLAKLMSDSGADVILGHHPHVLQPIEWIEADDGRQTLCIYSLGNLVSAMQYWQNMVGGFFTFEIVIMSDGSCYADSPEFIPTAFYYGPSYFNSHIYFLDDYPEEMAKTHGTKNLYNSYASPEDMRAYAEKILGDYISGQD